MTTRPRSILSRFPLTVAALPVERRPLDLGVRPFNRAGG